MNCKYCGWSLVPTEEAMRHPEEAAVCSACAPTARIIEVLRPFADYASGDMARKLPADFQITHGSFMARGQLKMKDCIRAATLVGSLEAQIRGRR